MEFLKYLTVYTMLFSLSCSGNPCKNLDSRTCPVLKDFQVFKEGETVHFDHLCSSLDHKFEQSSRQSYILFKYSSSKWQKAIVLTTLRLGWLNVTGTQGIALDLLEIKTEALWSKAFISISLEMLDTKTNQIIQGDFIDYYFKKPNFQSYYQLDLKGNMIWYDFLEPEEKTQTKINSSYNVPIPLIIYRSQIDLEKSYQLFLIIKNNNSQEKIKLKGPDIKNMKAFFQDIKQPEIKALNWTQTLNPFQKGSLWEALSYGAKYDACLYTRKKARQELKKWLKAH